MDSSTKDQVGRLLENANAFANKDGASIVSSIDANSWRVLRWLPYLEHHKTGTADELLVGVRSSLIEAVACAALGFVRPALFALRTEIDLTLTWLYFKDHPVEWDSLNSTGDGFKLKKEIFDYLTRYFDGFSERYALLNQVCSRREKDSYRFLSAHIHSQSYNTLPVANSLADVVRDGTVMHELVLIANDVDEYISDILLSLYVKDWVHIPGDVLKSVSSKIKSEGQKKVFFGKS